MKDSRKLKALLGFQHSLEISVCATCDKCVSMQSDAAVFHLRSSGEGYADEDSCR